MSRSDERKRTQAEARQKRAQANEAEAIDTIVALRRKLDEAREYAEHSLSVQVRRDLERKLDAAREALEAADELRDAANTYYYVDFASTTTRDLCNALTKYEKARREETRDMRTVTERAVSTEEKQCGDKSDRH